jgi:hypothetical protein
MHMDEHEQTKPDADGAKAGNEAAAQPAVLRMTVQVTRAATGKTETYEIVGTPMKEQS